MINWLFYPRSHRITEPLEAIIRAFRACEGDLVKSLNSNQVLAKVAETNELQTAGFQVETGKLSHQMIRMPVLFGPQGSLDKCFDVDAYHHESGTVLEVEAGRAVVNNQFLKDLFEACMMQDAKYLAVAVRNSYQGNKDFEKVVLFFDTLYTSGRLNLPLNGVLIIGY